MVHFLLCSDFGDIFDTDHFIASLKDTVRIIKELPKSVSEQIERKKLTRFYMHPGSWSNESYYAKIVRTHAHKYTDFIVFLSLILLGGIYIIFY